MRKGISAIQNINTMRWARHYNIDVGWNMLWGFPGETKEDYGEQAALIPLLTHLSPPSGYGRIWMERRGRLCGRHRSAALLRCGGGTVSRSRARHIAVLVGEWSQA